MIEMHPPHYPRCTNPSDADCMRDCDGCEWLEGERMSEYILQIESSADDELFTDIANMYGEVRSIGEEIVRCRDCRYMTSDMRINYCIRPAEYHEFAVEPDGFCAWSERRESC